jgi:catechol 2,3-dioxygenase-like lactoylglutathione lyase family enzyme
MTAALKLDHVTIAVTSFDGSMPYYDALLPLLGFTKERDHIWHDGSGFYFQFREAKRDTRPYERFGAGMNHLGFGAPDVETVERVRRAMAAGGFEVPDIQDLGGASALFMKDPDGIRFEITYYPPGMAVVD